MTISFASSASLWQDVDEVSVPVASRGGGERGEPLSAVFRQCAFRRGDTDALPAFISVTAALLLCNGDCEMKPIHRDPVKIRALIEAIKEAKIAGYINPVLADWVLEELKEGTA